MPTNFYLHIAEARNIDAYTLSDATSSTSTTVNQNYKLLGQSTGTNTKSGTNVYEGITTSTVRIYKNTSNAWVVATGTSVTTETSGTITVTSTGTAQFTEADTNKKDKLEDVEVFTPRGGSDVLLVQPKNLIPYEQSGKNTIAEYIRIHRKRAFLNVSSIEYDFFVDGEGANILNIANTSDNKAFVSYKSQLTLFTVQDSNTTDAQFSAVSNTTGTNAVPIEFFSYLAHASYADFLRMDGQHGKAITEETIAENYLNTELEKIDIRSNNNSINHKFSTYVNRQSR